MRTAPTPADHHEDAAAEGEGDRGGAHDDLAGAGTGLGELAVGTVAATGFTVTAGAAVAAGAVVTAGGAVTTGAAGVTVAAGTARTAGVAVAAGTARTAGVP